MRAIKAIGAKRMVRVLSGAPIVWLLLNDDESTAMSIHRSFVQEAWVQDDIGERIALVTGSLLWVPVTLVLVALCLRKVGARVRRETGKGRLRQAGEQLYLGLFKAVPPPWYYVFELYRDDRRSRALEYLYRQETKGSIYDWMRRWLSSDETSEALSDKAAFVARCREHGVAAVDALGTATDGSIQWRDDQAGAVPPRDLFLKPIRGAGGRGASRWKFLGDGQFQDQDGTTVGEEQLAQIIREMSMIEGYVVRPWVRNHHELMDLSPYALSTVRVLTCCDEQGRPEVTHAVLRMACSQDVVVDNFHAGGIAAHVDIQSGKLGRATNMGLMPDSRWWESHPTTGAPILGRTVPLWSEVVSLACRAHEAFADQVAIGWDIAVLDDGPSLVEGNKSPDLDIIQRVCEEPLGNSRFGRLLALHLSRAMDRKHTAVAAALTPAH